MSPQPSSRSMDKAPALGRPRVLSATRTDLWANQADMSDVAWPPDPGDVPKPSTPMPLVMPTETLAPIGRRPLLFKTGQFAGQVVRTELREIQRAELGRKFVNKDRRPIDPPPVVQARFFKVRDQATTVQHEEECNYQDVLPEGLVCYATLHEPRSADASTTSSSSAGQPLEPVPGLFGSTFVQCVRLTYQERSVLGFVFSDLSVQREGTFTLLYQCFDVMGVPPGTRRPILAECFGGQFRIYSNRQFPGLMASTELTKTLVEQGVRSNNRRKPRTRRKRGTSALAGHPFSTLETSTRQMVAVEGAPGETCAQPSTSSSGEQLPGGFS